MYPNAQKEATAMIECVMFVNSYVCGASGGAEEKRYAYLRRMLIVGIRISVQVCQSSVSSVKIFFGGASVQYTWRSFFPRHAEKMVSEFESD